MRRRKLATGLNIKFADNSGFKNTKPYLNNFASRCYFRRDEISEINCLHWPAVFPDMNSIEHVSDMLEQAMVGRENQARSIQEIVLAAQEEWCNIPQ